MIQVNNVSKFYAKGKVAAVNNVSMNVAPGQIYGFLGPNGAGKSTLIKCMLGVIPFEQGQIIIDGFDIVKEPIKAKMNMGFVPDNHVIYDKLTGRQYIDFICDIYKITPQKEKEILAKLVDLFQFEKYIDAPISSYSHGTKQKISVMSALVHEPKVWILDEPMTGLDPRSSYLLKQLMREHADKGNLVFFSSHVLDTVEKICDRIGIINHGELIGEYTAEQIADIKDDKSFEEFFLKITHSIDDIEG